MKKLLTFLALGALAFGANTNFDEAVELYKDGKFAQAYTSYNRACGEGVKKACTMNAIMLFNGDGVKKDNEQAERIFTKMCDENEPMACAKLAEMQAYGLTKDKIKDEARTRALFKKACEGGYEPACMWAGEQK
ncbi:sel1 repeat family protein [Campylobacter sp. RM13119]|uniref:tetratricopeptide repeat protein n=1 Tax=Campylobacter californiensis TaxID=1032243 RepID=UPI001473BF96|nr:tetratricopeptide repeat protein [Campylobacter sp. RM13119]MBE3605845.1 sel1 repeat family protein [Campylobacter sp. RM13119]